ncbi:hypothetical protein LZ32DRAFT_650600 [Colletotrichum eremochloae]|nr:hypothetical protein LZ32DRAFT_650600 [Colletotrichum eremochloae]
MSLIRPPPWMRDLPELLPAWMRNSWHDVRVHFWAHICICVFEYLFFSDLFLKTLFLVWLGSHPIVNNRLVFGALALRYAEPEVAAKLGLAALQSSGDLVVELTLTSLVFLLHYWRSPGQPIPDDRYIAAWCALSSVVSTVIGAVDDYQGMRWWHRFAKINPAFLCKSAEPFSLYKTCSHYAALSLLVRELDFTFARHQDQVVEEADGTPKEELTAHKIWSCRVRFLLWGLLVRFSVNVAFELVSDASGSLQCWYTQQGMEFLDWLPPTLRQLPFRVCALGVHCLLRYRLIGWLMEMVDMWVNPEAHEDDENGEEDWDWDGENLDELDDEDLGDDDLEENLDDDDENDEGPAQDADNTGSEGIIGEMDEDEDGAGYVYIHPDDHTYDIKRDYKNSESQEDRPSQGE